MFLMLRSCFVYCFEIYTCEKYHNCNNISLKTLQLIMKNGTFFTWNCHFSAQFVLLKVVVWLKIKNDPNKIFVHTCIKIWGFVKKSSSTNGSCKNLWTICLDGSTDFLKQINSFAAWNFAAWKFFMCRLQGTSVSISMHVCVCVCVCDVWIHFEL